ncbi:MULTISPECIES: twin-arginine translocase TatA/TatE family subunit [unclassified Halorhabdus]|uniref:twin-arginine translocase TatA/TatE family subunit n=1 Tax=unclassified Halorhabdus TaxID=2621901 RepID=UPI0023DB4D4D|nr:MULTISPECIES: twin-arginine translocase TatA/TatE family subunit [unclassified Halorhabdus]WEL17488.1 Sec-independent protein secretion pathway component [Halorhabdus sp. SVX81]WEL21366.1 Sec-independent protein secretion pathway component [Halorhabdus sp. BNX81]
MFETTILQVPGIPGGAEVLLLLLLAVLLFGANKIPKLARSSGQAIGEFQKGREQVEQELEEIQSGSSLDDESSDDAGVTSADADADSETSTSTN